jgi:hypothetical protein
MCIQTLAHRRIYLFYLCLVFFEHPFLTIVHCCESSRDESNVDITDARLPSVKQTVCELTMSEITSLILTQYRFLSSSSRFLLLHNTTPTNFGAPQTLT